MFCLDLFAAPTYFHRRLGYLAPFGVHFCWTCKTKGYHLQIADRLILGFLYSKHGRMSPSLDLITYIIFISINKKDKKPFKFFLHLFIFLNCMFFIFLIHMSNFVQIKCYLYCSINKLIFYT